jgi:hypothetical protein
VLTFLKKTKLWILAVPLALILVGSAANQAVLVANNDTFPVRENLVHVLTEAENAPEFIVMNDKLQQLDPDYPIMIDDTHCLMSPSTHLNWLADNFDLKDGIYSIGDFILLLGQWLWEYALIAWAVLVVKKLKDE